MPRYILTINGGSSSVKVALFETGATLEKKSAATIKSPNSRDAADGVFQCLKFQAKLSDIAAIGHRIVHGGPRYTDHSRILPELVEELHRIAPIDPDHLPGEIALIEAFQTHCPAIPQIACFDTVFHRDLPDVAKRLPLPRKYADAGIRRYGFHGLSYAYLMEELVRQAAEYAANGRVILAHLGAGASMAAVRDGKCIDTTMSFTPTAGLVMATRTGDLDPGVLVYLMRQEKLTADQIDELINKKSGLLGVSGSTSDMRELLGRRDRPRCCSDRRFVLLSSQKMDRSTRRRIGRPGHAGFQRRHRRTLAGNPRWDLFRLGPPGRDNRRRTKQSLRSHDLDE